MRPCSGFFFYAWPKTCAQTSSFLQSLSPLFLSVLRFVLPFLPASSCKYNFCVDALSVSACGIKSTRKRCPATEPAQGRSESDQKEGQRLNFSLNRFSLRLKENKHS